ncbi:MAG: hypothetical protein ACT4NY_21745 [Pseudonocardiales bacterium]
MTEEHARDVHVQQHCQRQQHIEITAGVDRGVQIPDQARQSCADLREPAPAVVAQHYLYPLA